MYSVQTHTHACKRTHTQAQAQTHQLKIYEQTHPFHTNTYTVRRTERGREEKPEILCEEDSESGKERKADSLTSKNVCDRDMS